MAHPAVRAIDKLARAAPNVCGRRLAVGAPNRSVRYMRNETTHDWGTCEGEDRYIALRDWDAGDACSLYTWEQCAMDDTL